MVMIDPVLLWIITFEERSCILHQYVTTTLNEDTSVQYQLQTKYVRVLSLFQFFELFVFTCNFNQA